MEMLNNIWIALSTENVEFVNFMMVPISFIEAHLILMLFMNSLNIPGTKNQKFIYIISSSVCTIINSFFVPEPFKLFLNYIIIYILIYIIFKQSPLKTLIALFLPMIVFALTNVLILKIYIELLNIPYEQASIVPIYRFLYLLIVYSVIALVIFIFKHKNFKIKILEDFDKKTKRFIIINFTLGLFTILLQAIILFYYIDFAELSIIVSNFIVLVIYFFINLYTLSKITKLTITTRELETAEAYNKSITALYDNVKGFKHDFDNIVSAIGGYVETNDMKGLKEYYHSLRDDCQKSNNIATLNPNIINNPAVYSILCSKYNKADSLGIKINLEFFVDLKNFNIKSYEFSRILGILLDNAIEAASECDEKLININFRTEFKRNRNVVIISNTYKDKSVNTEKIFEKGKSGKPNHSGLGLWEVRQYMNKNENLNLYTTKDDKYFTQQLEIYNNKK